VAVAGWTMEGTTVYVPLLNEVSSPQITTASRWTIDWTINHLPPDGAKYWRWGYAANSLCSQFVQYVIHSISAGVDTEDHMTDIDITPLQTIKTTIETVGATWNQITQSNIDPYIWEKGDRVRFITEGIGNQTLVGTVLGSVIEGVYDYEIIKQSTDLNHIFIQEIDYVSIGIWAESLIEIYRPLGTPAESKKVYYEFGDLMPIIEDANGYLVHGGVTQDQAYLVTAATGTFDAGDVYHIMRTPSRPISFAAGETQLGAIHESQWWSDFYDSNEWDKGKQGYETTYGRRELNIIRFSLQYMQDTQINGLATFLGGRYKELNDTYGEIMGMEEVGDTLKVYQERKPSSIQLGRIERSDESGKISISLSSDVLGSIRYSTTKWGTEFRESIIKNNRFVYGFDIHNGVVWRDSANGIFPISGRYASPEGDSDYKMATYFKQKAKALLESGVDFVDVITMWDEEYKLLYVTFRDYVNEANDETVVFHEPSNRWICIAEHNCTEEYNTMLELDYWVTRGFNGGIGYSFNEEDRFAYFNIVSTGAGVIAIFGYLDIEIEPLNPTVTASSTGIMTLREIEIELLTPTLTISFVNASESSLDWDYDESFADIGILAAKVVTILVLPGDAILFSYPDWMTVLDSSGNTMVANDPIPTGDTVSMYPIVSNDTYNPLTGTVVFKNIVGTAFNLTVIHNERPGVPAVPVNCDLFNSQIITTLLLIFSQKVLRVMLVYQKLI
jgi:hypothetical protein